MNAHLSAASDKLDNGCDRAEGLRLVFEYMNSNAPAAYDCSDILRSATVLSVSAFDLFVHEIYRLEILRRLEFKQDILALKVPFAAMIAPESLKADIVDDCVRRENSYKSFVAPDKVADCLRVLIENPWEKIAAEAGSSPAELKAQLKGVVDLRNRIAHEADINPAYAGIELWPIYSVDVAASIIFLRKLGADIAAAVSKATST